MHNMERIPRQGFGAQTLKEVYLSICDMALVSQGNDGSMPGGCNGPYLDMETPVRNTGHWGMAFIKAFQLSQDPRFEQAAMRCFDFLVGDGEYRAGGVFRHRHSDHKDTCNGVIGPAWSIEALSAGFSHFGEPEYYNVAREVFESVPFHEKTGLWHRVEPTGKPLGLDATLNHQLWMAAAASLIAEQGCALAHERMRKFLGSLDRYFFVYPSGRIFHYLSRPKTIVKDSLRRLLKRNYRRSMFLKEVGYQTFNLYAFAMLKESIGEFSFSIDRKISKACSFCESDIFLREIEQSIHGFPYNPPGFEIPYSLFILTGRSPEQIETDWISWQFRRTLDASNLLLSSNVPDALTLTARIYELSRLPNGFFNHLLEEGRA